MPADVTARTPLAPPGKTAGEAGPVEYVEVVIPNGQVVVTPFRAQRAGAVRARIAELGLTGQDVRDAVAWARKTRPAPRTKGKRVPEVRATSHRAPALPRVVLDTEPVLSALVVSGGATSALRTAWQSRRFIPLASKATAGELMRAFACPRFALTAGEREDLLFDYLLFCDFVEVPIPPPSTPAGGNRYDTPFLELAIAGRSDCLVTGDRDLPSPTAELPCPIARAGDFLSRLEPA